MTKNLKDIYVGVRKNDPNRNQADFYPTPPLATFILKKYVDVPREIVEPCAGRGNISIELLRHNHIVHSYDLHKYDNSLCHIETNQDFLDLKPPSSENVGLITNPPYHKDLPRKIAEKSLNEYNFTALFLRLTFLEGKKRNKLFTENPPSDIIFLSDRIRFGTNYIEPIEMKDQIGGMIAYMWIVWDKRKPQKNTKMHWALLENNYDEWRKNYDNWLITPERIEG
jgi:hypothetical protein